MSVCAVCGVYQLYKSCRVQGMQQKGAVMAPAAQKGERGLAAAYPQGCHADVSMDGPD